MPVYIRTRLAYGLDGGSELVYLGDEKFGRLKMLEPHDDILSLNQDHNIMCGVKATMVIRIKDVQTASMVIGMCDEGIIYLSELPAPPHGPGFQSGQTMLSSRSVFTVPAGAVKNDGRGSANCQHGLHDYSCVFIGTLYLHAVMRPVMAAATAPAATVATTEQVDTTATAASAAPPAQKKRSRSQSDGTMIRNIKVDFDQSRALSKLVSHRMDQQRWAFNMAVREKLKDPRVTEFDLNNMLTGWRNGKGWMKGGFLAQRAGLLLGLDAVKKFMDSNGKKRSNKSLWKYLARRDREKNGIKDIDIDTAPNLPSNKWSAKRNKWSHTNDLFKRKGEQRSLSVVEKPVYKGNNMVMLPGIGTVRVHGDVEGLDMRSFQLVETTKRTTKRTESHNRTYRLHIQIRTKAPEPAESGTIRGVDMGIVHGAATVDLDTGRHAFHDLPKDCRRSKDDDLSRMYFDLSQKRGGRGNRRIRQDTKEGADCGNSTSGSNTNTSGNSNANNTRGHNKNKTRKPKSRSYRELQRKIRKKREKIANRQTNWERHASKRIADGAGTVAMEDLSLNNMTAKGKGKGSSAKTGLNREMAYSRPGTFQRQIMGACANAGVIVIMVDPKGTSITCHKCGHSDRESRTSQDRFRCTNDNCYNDINADVNAAHNIASRAEAVAAGRQGLSSEGARSQRGIAPARSANSTREPSVGCNARAPEKGIGAVH